jgi:PAS domain S-box-containing protein
MNDQENHAHESQGSSSEAADPAQADIRRALRQRAEEIARERAMQDSGDLAALSPEEAAEVLHELQVHQIELEMQNAELHRAQEELEASRERYFDLYDLAPVGYCTISEQGLILEANLTAATLLETSRNGLVRQSLSRFILSDDQDIYYLHRRALFATGAPQKCELRMLRGAVPFWARLEATVSPDVREAPMCRLVISDISARKQAEEALRASEALLRTLIDHLPANIYVKDIEARKVLANRTDVATLGYASEAEILGKTDLELMPADIAKGPYADDLKVLRNGEAVIDREELLRNAAGEWVWMLTSKIPLRDEQGRVTGLVGIGHDITERKRDEEQRLEMERQLLHTQKLESLGVLAGGVAHDFNNLLTAILGNLEMAKRELSPVSPVRASIEEATKASLRAADLTRQMLAYSGRGHFVVGQIDLGELVQENAHMLRTAIPRTVTLKINLADGLPPIEGDSGQLQQMVMNLITNAAEAIGDQPGVVSLATGTQECDEEVLRHSRLQDRPSPGRYVWLEVSDNGCGMTKETQERLFEPFFTTKFTGRGLGMSAVLGIVRGHQGAIMVDSAVGQGTTVRVLFPVSGEPRKEQEPLSSARRVEQQDGPHLRGKVLIVDDDGAQALHAHGRAPWLSGPGGCRWPGGGEPL